MFKSLKANNFLSWSDLQVEFESGVTLIEGYNHDDQTPEGSGKSAIPNALVWCLYGKLPKDAKIDDVIKEGQKSCVVEVELLNGFRVRRSRKPNKLEMYIPSVDGYTEGKDTKETQQIIEERLGFGFDTFCQTVYFAQNYPKKFVTANEEEKAKILSELQDLQIFDVARKKAHEKARALDNNLDTLQREYESLEKDCDRLEDSIFEAQTTMQNVQNEFKQRKLTVVQKIYDITQQIEKYELPEDVDYDDEINELIEKQQEYREETATVRQKIKNAEKNNSAVARVQRQIRKTEKKYEDIQEEIDEVLESESPKCPTCNQDLKDKKVLKQHITELKNEQKEVSVELKELTKELDGLEVTNVDDLENTLDRLQKMSSKVETKVKKLKSEKSEVESKAKTYLRLEEHLKSLVKQKEELQEPDTKYLEDRIKKHKKSLKSLTNELRSTEKNYKSLKKQRDSYVTLKQAFRSIKSYVFQTLLVDLTRRTNQYLASLFTQDVKLVFSNTGEDGEISKIQTDVTIDGIERPLGLYSGGQFRRIQLAVDLALSDILSLRAKNPVNFLIFDEAFKDLSENSMEKIIEFLQGLKRTVLVIEHNSLIKSIVSNSIEVELIDGTSNLKGYSLSMKNGVKLSYASSTMEMSKMQNGD